jgi:hypothetical protein
MPDSNTNIDEITEPKPLEIPKTKVEDDDLVKKLVDERVSENLKPIKDKLDNAFAARDEALKRVAEYEQKEKEAELKRLQDEGKHKEAYEMQLAEEKAKREVLEKRNIELTRDIELRSILNGYSFRSNNASEMAYKEVVGQLVQGENGIWTHRSGISVSDFVKTFSENEDNSFLFKPKLSSGSGGSSVKGTTTDRPSSLFNMSQEEVLKRAAEGKLR